MTRNQKPETRNQKPKLKLKFFQFCERNKSPKMKSGKSEKKLSFYLFKNVKMGFLERLASES